MSDMLAEAATTAQTARTEVLDALRHASAVTGSDFDYLLGTAMRESSLKPEAKSKTSSAAGLFQFVSQTWLGMVKQYGAKFGLGSYADVISKGTDGHYHVKDASDRHAILSLRNDPKVSALMAGEYAQQTKNTLENRLGRDVCGGELYAAHFLGAGGACKLIEMNDRDPGASAAACFPAAAHANRSVFYNHDGSARTVRQVYDWVLKQPQVSQKVLAQVDAQTDAGTAAEASAVPSLSMASALFAQPTHSTAEDLSTLGLFASAPAMTSTSSLLQSTAMLQQPFVLTPGVVKILASLTPDDTSQDGNKSETNGLG